MQDVKNQLVQKLKPILPYTEISGNNVRLSTALTKGGKPLTIINTKQPTASLWLIVKADSITIKVIENSLKKFSGTDMWLKILEVVDEQKKQGKEYTILIDDDQSGGWWDKIIAKYGDRYNIKKNPIREMIRQLVSEELKNGFRHK